MEMLLSNITNFFPKKEDWQELEEPQLWGEDVGQFINSSKTEESLRALIFKSDWKAK